MRKVCLENVMLTGHIEDKTGRGKQRVTYLTSLCEWVTEHKTRSDSKGKNKPSEHMRPM